MFLEVRTHTRGVGEAVSLLVVVLDNVAAALARLLVDLLLRPRPRVSSKNIAKFNQWKYPTQKISIQDIKYL